MEEAHALLAQLETFLTSKRLSDATSNFMRDLICNQGLFPLDIEPAGLPLSLPPRDPHHPSDRPCASTIQMHHACPL